MTFENGSPPQYLTLVDTPPPPLQKFIFRRSPSLSIPRNLQMTHPPHLTLAKSDRFLVNNIFSDYTSP